MKKITSIILLLVMLLSMAILSACTPAHKCTPDEEWTYDENSHWHKCAELPYVELFGISYMDLLKASCAEVFDKADHTWDAGTITTPATQEADGIKTFTCSVCNGTKTEPVPYTGMTKGEWNAVFEKKQFENFTYTETSVLKTTGMEMETVTTYEFEKEKARATATVAGQTETQSFAAAQATILRSNLLTSLEPLVKFEDFRYDAATKSYVLKGIVIISALNVKADTMTLTFEDGKLVKMVYTCKITQNGITFDVTSTVLFTDYGTTVVK